MVAPWDAHRSQLPGWNSDDEVAGGRETFDDPPPLTNQSEFSTPDYKVDQTEFDLPSDSTSNQLGNENKPMDKKRRLPRARTYPVALFAVAACVLPLWWYRSRLACPPE